MSSLHWRLHSFLSTHAEYRDKMRDLMATQRAPFYVYNLDLLKERLQAITSEKPEECGVRFWYACKANPLGHIIDLINQSGWGADVASPGELDQVFRRGFAGEKLLSTGPAKSFSWCSELLTRGVRVFVAESYNQLKNLQDASKALKIRPRVLLRVQFSSENAKEKDKAQMILGGEKITPFGLSPEDWYFFQNKDYPDVNVVGFHTFQWGNVLNTKELETLWNQTLGKLKILGEKIHVPLSIVDLGGGLGIPYQNGEESIPCEWVLPALKRLKASFHLDEVWMELGRFAVGECGMYLTPVVDRKRVRGQEMLILQGGINHMCRPALTQSAFPATSVRIKETQLIEDHERDSKKSSFSMHGPLCTALDWLGVAELPLSIDVGDWILFWQCGAYGFTESMPFFLAHDLPAEVCLQEGRLTIPRPWRRADSWLV
jgi:diaminopimelate decarboxylase